MSSKVIAYLLFPIGLTGLGALSLLYGDFAMVWQPVPEGIPLRTPLAYLSGLLLVAGGIGLLVRRWAARAAAVMAWFLLSWLVLLQLPRVVKSPVDVGVWLGVGETLVLVTGAWSMFLLLQTRTAPKGSGWFVSARALRTAQLVFAIALPIIGVSHFVYADATAGMVPAWFPARRVIAYLTGAAHAAAGVGIILGILPRLAATLEAVMVGCFVVLLHAPAVLAAPHDRLQWTMLCVALALDGSCWAIAATLADQPWIAGLRVTAKREA